jgi:hypothetical protein
LIPPLTLIFPLPLAVSFIYVPCHLIFHWDDAPFAGKGSRLYIFLRLGIMLLTPPLFFLGSITGIMMPLTCLLNSLGLWRWLVTLAIFIELAAMPLSISALLYYGVDFLFFKPMLRDIRQYLKYSTVLYYVSIALLTVYGFVFAMALMAGK